MIVFSSLFLKKQTPTSSDHRLNNRGKLCEHPRQRAEERHRRADAELSALEPARPVEALQAEIDGLLMLPGINGCVAVDGPRTAATCPRVVTLRTELARAQRRRDLEASLLQAE